MKRENLERVEESAAPPKPRPDACPNCGSETVERGYVTIPPLSVGSVAMFGREELCTNQWHDEK